MGMLVTVINKDTCFWRLWFWTCSLQAYTLLAHLSFHPTTLFLFFWQVRFVFTHSLQSSWSLKSFLSSCKHSESSSTCLFCLWNIRNTQLETLCLWQGKCVCVLAIIRRILPCPPLPSPFSSHEWLSWMMPRMAILAGISYYCSSEQQVEHISVFGPHTKPLFFCRPGRTVLFVLIN